MKDSYYSRPHPEFDRLGFSDPKKTKKKKYGINAVRFSENHRNATRRPDSKQPPPPCVFVVLCCGPDIPSQLSDQDPTIITLLGGVCSVGEPSRFVIRTGPEHCCCLSNQQMVTSKCDVTCRIFFCRRIE